MTKVHAKAAAIELRKAGHSYHRIAASVGVSKGTLAVWLADIPYTPNLETIERIGKARAASGEVKSRLKRDSFQRARMEARTDVGRLSRRDLFMLGLGLYIGEGAKSTSQTCFVNSNPAIVSLLIRWFIKAVGLKKENLRIRLHIYPDCNEDKSLQFWSETTTIPRSQFLKTIVDWRKDKKAFKSGKLPHGTAHLSVNSLGEKRFGVFLARKILAWSDEVLGTKNAGLV